MLSLIINQEYENISQKLLFPLSDGGKVPEEFENDATQSPVILRKKPVGRQRMAISQVGDSLTAWQSRGATFSNAHINQRLAGSLAKTSDETSKSDSRVADDSADGNIVGKLNKEDFLKNLNCQYPSP